MSRKSPSGFLDSLSGGDPTLKLFLALGAGMVALALLFAAAIVAIPLAVVGGLILLLYRYYRLQQMRTSPNLPAIITPPTIVLDGEISTYASPQEFSQSLANRQLLNQIEAPTGSYSCQPLADGFNQMAGALYAQESFYGCPPKPDTNDRILLGRYKDEVAAWHEKVSDPTNLGFFLNVLSSSFLNLRQHFPSFAMLPNTNAAPSALTTALLPQIADHTTATEELISNLFQPEVIKRKLFRPVRDQMQANADAVGGIPSQLKQRTTLQAYVANTPLEFVTNVDVPVTLDDETRFAGMWVIAPQGMGKTTLLHSMLLDDIEKDASIILMDSKGDLIEPFLTMDAIAHRRIIIGPDHPIGMNPLDIPRTDINKAVDNLEYLFASLLDFKLTAAQSMLLKAVLRSLVTVFPNPTLGTFQEIMSEGPKKYAEHIKNLEPDLQNFFKNEFFTENIKARRQEVLQRLRLLLDHDLLRSMLMASSTTFNIGQAMDAGAFIIINNSRGRLGNKGAEFFGRFFIAQVLAAAQQRSFRNNKDKKATYFFIDECHTVIAQDDRVTDILHECRSQKIALCLAHQETSQVSDKVLSALQNCAIRFAHPDEEARKLSGALRMPTEVLQSMRRGQFGGFVRGLAKQGVVLNVTRPDFSRVKASKRLSPDQIRKYLRARYNEAPQHIRETIHSTETEKLIRGLADANNLNEYEFERLENEAMMALLQVQPVERLEQNIAEQVSLSPDAAQRVGKELALFVARALEQAKYGFVLKQENTLISFSPRPPEMEPWRLDMINAPPPDSLAEIDERFDRAPKLIQDIIRAPETAQHLHAIAEAHKLNSDQGKRVEHELILVLLDLQPPTRLEENIAEQAAIPTNVASKIAADITRRILKPLYSTRDSSAAPPSQASGTPPASAPGTDDPGEPAEKW